MRKRALTKGLLAALVILTGLGLGFGLSKIGATRRPVGSKAPIMPQKEAEDTRPLKEKAREAGSYVKDRAPKKIGAFSDLAGLTRDSSAVVVGVPGDNVSVLSADGKGITIDYKVSVQYVYKSDLNEGDVITVSVPGGRVSFDDGSTAEVRTPWFKKMMTGKTYVLFLSPTERPGVFVTTGEAQGVFEIPTTRDNRIIQTHAGLPKDPMWKYNGTDPKTFFKELRKVTGKRLER